MNNVCIIIATHKEILEKDEERSFVRALDVFKNRDIKLVLPDDISKVYYEQYKDKNYNFEYVTVKKEWMKDSKSYNKMCCLKEFWESFQSYDYALIYQTDCWVYEDRLDEFMELGYDWYGAPWPHLGDKVGNGGFSLRKVSKMIEITDVDSNENAEAEDTWFCLGHKDKLKVCDLETACNFSMEAMSPKYFSMTKTIPMGLHGKFVKRLWDENGESFVKIKEKYKNFKINGIHNN